ncbi:MAG: intradiol ring-cleavage dioxygenase [Alphaproteobacteria bacterium]
MERTLLSRRRWLLGGTAAAAALGVAGRPTATMARLALTPRQGAGPFYPLELPLERDADLASVEGAKGPPAGTITHVAGRVLDTDGRPIRDALVEIWQANAFGRYHHPGDRSGGPIDPNFQGYGQTVTNDDGAYRFRTIRPVPYSRRAPHIHFTVAGRGFDKLITQMYIEGERANERDFLLSAVRDPAARRRLIVPLEPAPDRETGALLGRFDIVIARS